MSGTKVAVPYSITRAEKLELSVFLPNDLSLDDWYAEVYTPFASPAASLGILSGSQSGSSSLLHPWLGHPSHSHTSFHHPSLSSLLIFFYLRCSLFTSDPSFSLWSRVSSLYPLYSFLSSLYLYLPTFLPPFVASLDILSGSSLSLLLPPVPLLPLVTALSSHLFSPSTPAFPLRFPSPPPLLSLKVFAQSGLAQRGSTFCRCHPKWLSAAMSDVSCCASPLLFCHHCALLLWAAYHSGAAYVGGCCGSLCTLLSLGNKLATLLFGACLSSFSSINQQRWAMWDQPVAYCPARPPMPFSSSLIPRLGSIISFLWSLNYRLLIFSENQPVAYCPACLPALSSSLISLPHLPPSTSFTSPISLPVEIFVSLMLRWLLSLGETLLVLSSIPSYTCILPCL